MSGEMWNRATLTESENRRLHQFFQLGLLRDTRPLGDEGDIMPHRRPFKRFLEAAKYFDSTDPRDKIYGVLGLVTAEERDQIHVGYQKTTERVYIEAAKHMLQHDRSNFWAAFSPAKRGDSDLPSWVP